MRRYLLPSIIALSFASSALPSFADSGPLQEQALMRAADGSATLKFKFESEGRCMVGDLDIIARELEHSRGTQLLFSVEPLGPSRAAFPPITEHTSLEQLSNGYESTIRIPANNVSDLQLGVYICKDTGGSGRCGDKEQKDFNELYKFYGSTTSAASKASDKIYFFQFLNLHKESLQFFGKNKLDEKEQQNFREQQVKQGAWGASPKDITDAADKALQLQGSVASVPLKSINGKLIANLPHIDKTKCH